MEMLKDLKPDDVHFGENFKYKYYIIPSGLKVKHSKSMSSPKHVMTIESSFIQAMDLFNSFKPNKKDKKYNIEGRAITRNSNKDVFDTCLSPEYSTFRGGSLADLDKLPDMTEFNLAKNKLKQSNLYKKLDTIFHQTHVRKRKLNEYDGDYDHDKRFDVNPFQRACKGLSPVKKLTMNVNLSFSCGIGSKTIDKYGSTIAAICNLLESYGVLVEINMLGLGRGSLSNKSSSEQMHIDTIRVKKANQYLPVQSLIKIFNSNFYRRVVFTRKAIVAEFYGDSVDSGLGRPQEFDEYVGFSRGEIFIYSHSALDNQDEFLKNIESALGIVDNKKK